MGDKSKIPWTDATWNPVTGCSPMSSGCANCYARRMALRLEKMGSQLYQDGFTVRLHSSVLEKPERWTKPRMIFVCSMGDLFHRDVPECFILRVLEVIEACPRHTFQVLTKRAERMANLLGGRKLPPNLWLGVSAENQHTFDSRVPHLFSCDPAVRWVSLEPLLGEVVIPFGYLDRAWRFDARTYTTRLDWVVVGCESGPRRRPCRTIWVSNVANQCRDHGVPCFPKQLDLGGRVSKDPAEWPAGLRLRQYPNQMVA